MTGLTATAMTGLPRDGELPLCIRHSPTMSSWDDSLPPTGGFFVATPLFIVDAFTDEPFRGNPAAVCLLDADTSIARSDNVFQR